MSTEKASVYSMDVYKKDGVTYVPHYRNSSIFVGPGYPHACNKRYTAEELVLAGAKKDVGMLWSRAQHGEVTDTKP
jgi:hypothetical protein